MTTVVGVRCADLVATHSTPSSASIVRTMSPATSSPSGAATAADSPSRAAATAVIAPPRRPQSSAANRSSPSSGSDSSPTNVRSRRQAWQRRDLSRTTEDNQVDDQATRARTASPVRSGLETKPRAPDSATSEPKSVLSCSTQGRSRWMIRHDAAARPPRTRRCRAAPRRGGRHPVRGGAPQRPRTRRRWQFRRR